MTTQPTDSKKDLILNTARLLLARQGFAKTTLDDIANALGMKKSSLYYYYTNKDALLDDVMKREQENYFSAVLKSVEQSDSAIDKIINFEKTKFGYLQESLKFHDMNAGIMLELKGKMFRHIQSIHQAESDIIDKILQEGARRNEIKKCNTKKVAKLILTFSEALRHREFYFASFSVDKTIDFNKVTDEMIFAVKLIFDGLKINNEE